MAEQNTREYVELRALSKLQPEEYRKFREAVEQGYIVVGCSEKDQPVVRRYSQYCRAAGRPYVRVTRHPAYSEVALNLCFAKKGCDVPQLSRPMQRAIFHLFTDALDTSRVEIRTVKVGSSYCYARGIAEDKAEAVAREAFALACEDVKFKRAKRRLRKRFVT